MHNEDDEPYGEGQTAGGKGDEHKPAEDAELVEERAAIDAVDDAGVDGAFVDFAAVRVRDPAAGDDGADGREGERGDKDEYYYI